MNEINRIAEHADDGALVRFLDQQASGDERRWLFAHLGGCGACAARMDGLREQSEAVSRGVGALGASAPDEMTRARALAAARTAQGGRARDRRWYSAGGVRAAAVVTLAALASLSADPVRAWMVDRWSQLVGSEESVPAVAARPGGVLDRGSVISFPPAGETFVLEIEHPQASGTVALELREVNQASAQVINGRTEEILVLPSGVRVANSSSSTASYAFTLPTGLRLIQVFAGGRPVAILPVEDVRLPWSHTVSLDPADSSR